MIGVIPAGGTSSRFMGIHKEMLPIGNGKFLITEAMNRARALGASRCVIVTSAEKAAFHERFLSPHDTLLVSTGRGLWGAIRETFPIQERSILILPDTLFTIQDALPSNSLAFGTFTTLEAHRYSILAGDSIVTKPEHVMTPQQAWGCVAWNPEVVEFWGDTVYDHYDHAFSAAMRVFRYATFAIGDYHDFGNWESYARFIKNTEEL